MPKTIALHSTDNPVARLLKQNGYKVVDFNHPLTNIDAALHAGYRPDMADHLSHAAHLPDITLGRSYDDSPLTINITGKSPNQVLSELAGHLRHKEN